MSLQQALLTRVPLAKKRDELYRILSATRWSTTISLSDNEKPNFIREVQEARQQFFIAQDQLRRLS